MFSTPPAGKQGIHYHIRWSNSQIDWQPFNSSAEATAMAERLARPKEIFTIEAFDDDCPRCAETRAAAAKAGHA